MYTTVDFKNKKLLKEAVKAGQRIGIFQPGGMFPTVISAGGSYSVEGPHYPKPHSWYARVKLGADKCIDSVS